MMREKIKQALIVKGMTQKELAAILGMTQQNFSNRLSREAFSEKELIKIAGIIGCEYEMSFTFPDGKII